MGPVRRPVYNVALRSPGPVLPDGIGSSRRPSAPPRGLDGRQTRCARTQPGRCPHGKVPVNDRLLHEYAVARLVISHRLDTPRVAFPNHLVEGCCSSGVVVPDQLNRSRYPAALADLPQERNAPLRPVRTDPSRPREPSPSVTNSAPRRRRRGEQFARRTAIALGPARAPSRRFEAQRRAPHAPPSR